MNKVSILVAVYNAEMYLAECLDSLLNQTLHNIEIIAVDDASTDTSWNILEQYALQDSRLIIIQQKENKGQAVARNLALQYANAQYITMVDSDDWLALDALQKAVEVFEQHSLTDVVVLELMQCFEQDGKREVYPICCNKDVISGYEGFRLSLNWNLHGLYLVRSEIHKKYPYDETCRLYSDDNTTRIHFLHAREIRFCEGIYFYRKHSRSMTNAVNMRRFDYMEANLSMKNQLLKEHIETDVLNFYEYHRWLNFIGIYFFFYKNKAHFTNSQQKEIYNRMKNTLKTIEQQRIPISKRCKLGYIYLSCFSLFRLQEEFYFLLRKLSGRN